MELRRLECKSAFHTDLQFENTWLARYPRPTTVIYDQGKEFIGRHFQHVLDKYGIRKHPTSVKAPQANAICERMHQTVGNSLRAMAHLQPPQGVENAAQMVDTALANCMYATRVAVHGTLKASPGSLAFNRDIVLDIPFIADWEFIRKHRQQLVDRRLIQANKRRFSYDYHIGDRVLKLAYEPNKMQPRAMGPFSIETVHANGTVTI